MMYLRIVTIICKRKTIKYFSPFQLCNLYEPKFFSNKLKQLITNTEHAGAMTLQLSLI